MAAFSGDVIAVTDLAPVPYEGKLFSGSIRPSSIVAILAPGDSKLRVHLQGGHVFDAPTDGGKNAGLVAFSTSS